MCMTCAWLFNLWVWKCVHVCNIQGTSKWHPRGIHEICSVRFAIPTEACRWTRSIHSCMHTHHNCIVRECETQSNDNTVQVHMVMPICVYTSVFVCKSIIVYLICDCKCHSWCHQCRMHASNRVCCSVLWYVVLCHALCWCCVLWCVVLCYLMHGGCVELCCAVLWCGVVWSGVVVCRVMVPQMPSTVPNDIRFPSLSFGLANFLSFSLFQLYIYF